MVLSYAYLCVVGGQYMHVRAGAPGGQGRTLALVDLELQVPLSDPTWVLGTAL